MPFIRSVKPEFVIFSAGHKYGLPNAAVADRYVSSGVSLDKILRTDRGDDEGEREWSYGRIPGNRDVVGDDDIDIIVRENGEIHVAYRMVDRSNN